MLKITYTGSGDFLVTNLNADGSVGDMTSFHLEGVPSTGASTPNSALVPTPATPRTYTVQPRDTLMRLAKRFGVTLNALIAANSLRDPNLIRVGQALIIPAK
ncbi:MAG: LysM peptidoglycan-binding domain-containing protein [Chloroflexi bacterium]|nr:LysM peptidoglycan-binding domain-containing protein [Chloroflexota bacterium]